VSALIEARGLAKTYRLGQVDVAALRGVDVDVGAGEFVAIVGPSGSGKSTLMHILGCLDGATAGSYRLDGEDVSGFTGRRLAHVRNRKVGFVFQTFNLIPACRSGEWPCLSSTAAACPGASGTSGPARCSAPRPEPPHRPPADELSGASASGSPSPALDRHPGILMADEPTGNLDSAAGSEVLKTFDELHAAGHTIVLVTHDPNVAARAQRTIHIADGQVVA
jgi:putative ABC transport system ATP-binding protein